MAYVRNVIVFETQCVYELEYYQHTLTLRDKKENKVWFQEDVNTLARIWYIVIHFSRGGYE